LALTAVLAGVSGLAFAADDGWQARVGEALGKTGSAAPGGIYRVGLPRTDLKVTLDGVELKPGFALGGWLAFVPMGDQAMVMGDLVLTMDEVSPVMKKLAEGGIEVTALHNSTTTCSTTSHTSTSCTSGPMTTPRSSPKG